MDIARARYLVSAEGRAALASLGRELRGLDTLQLSKALRKRFAPVEAAALAEQVTLSAKAESRGAARAGFLYTAHGLEMMTHPLEIGRAHV